MYYAFDNTSVIPTDLDISTVKVGLNYRFGY
jgi:hypothetical protein